MRNVYGDGLFKSIVNIIDEKLRKENPLITTNIPIYQKKVLPPEYKKSYDEYYNLLSDEENGTSVGGAFMSKYNERTGGYDHLICLDKIDENNIRHEDNHAYLDKKWKREGIEGNEFLKEGLAIAIEEIDEESYYSKEDCKDIHRRRMEAYKEKFGITDPLEKAIEISKEGIKNLGLETTTLLAKDSVIETRNNNFHKPDLEVYKEKIESYKSIFDTM